MYAYSSSNSVNNYKLLTFAADSLAVEEKRVS